MSWTFETTKLDGSTFSVVLPDADFRDVETFRRRQDSGETDGGQLFVQDRGVEDRFVDAQWSGGVLDRRNRSDLILFLREVLWRARPFKITVTGGHFPVGLNTGQSLQGVPLNTGDVPACDPALNTGITVQPDTAIVGGVRLEQSEAALEQFRDAASDVVLRFRVPGGPVVAGSN